MRRTTEALREDFPILRREVHGKPLIYLDNAATTQKPRIVVEQIVDSYYRINANIHRGVHLLSNEATEAHERARETVHSFINARSSSEIIFTRGTTDGINLVASSFAKLGFQEGDEVIVTSMEHHSNIVPWQLQGYRLKVVPFNERGELDMDSFETLFTERTRMVAVTHVSNVLGTVNPVDAIIQLSHQHDVPVLIDGAQAVGHLPVDMQQLDADFYAFSAHKMYGPTGIGILYGKSQWLDRLPPYQGGGEMISKVTFEKTTYNTLPYKFEAGTPDYVGSRGLAAAIGYLEAIGWENLMAHEQMLLEYATQRLLSIEEMRLFGRATDKSGVLSFQVGTLHPYDVGMLLDQQGIAVRTGHHCAEPLMHILGVEGTVRASFGLYNTKDEVDRLVAGIKRVKQLF